MEQTNLDGERKEKTMMTMERIFNISNEPN